MVSRPPLDYIKDIPAYDLIELTADCIIASVENNHLEHALGRVADRLPSDLFPRLKDQLDRTNGLVKLMVERRIKWDAWPTGPVAEKTDE